jgi:hypothetical protein
MKKSLIIGIVGLAAISSFGQGQISLSNYSSSLLSVGHPLQDIIYGAGSGGTMGIRVANNSTAGGPFTAGLYYVNTSGNFTANFAADPTGWEDPTTLYSGPGVLTLATGPGATGGIGNLDTGTPGEYGPSQAFNPGLGQGVTITAMTIAYNGSSYANAFNRGHSTAYTIVTSVGTTFPNLTGVSESDGGFAVLSIPEPSVLALSSLGALMLVRRKK